MEPRMVLGITLCYVAMTLSVGMDSIAVYL